MPGRAAAPGPGRSADESTSVLKLGGMQKMLASFDALAGPPVVKSPAGAPASTIVRVTSSVVKAPAVRCAQLVKPPRQVPPAQQSAPGVGPPVHVPPEQLPPEPQFFTSHGAPAF